MQMIEHRDEATGFVVRAVEIDGETWFVAKDVCDILEIENSRSGVERLDEDEVGETDATDACGRAVKMNTVNESGLYTLILRSNKPKAREFRRWVTHEVLPSIRRTGSYALLAGQSAPPMPIEHPVTQFLRTTRYACSVSATYSRTMTTESPIDTENQSAVAPVWAKLREIQAEKGEA